VAVKITVVTDWPAPTVHPVVPVTGHVGLVVHGAVSGAEEVVLGCTVACGTLVVFPAIKGVSIPASRLGGTVEFMILP